MVATLLAGPFNKTNSIASGPTADRMGSVQSFSVILKARDVDLRRIQSWHGSGASDTTCLRVGRCIMRGIVRCDCARPHVRRAQRPPWGVSGRSFNIPKPKPPSELQLQLQLQRHMQGTTRIVGTRGQATTAVLGNPFCRQPLAISSLLSSSNPPSSKT